MRWTDFESDWSPHTPAAEDREDGRRSLRFSVHNRAFALMGFSPTLVAVHEELETNAQLYDCKRTRGGSASCGSSDGAGVRGSGVPGSRRCRRPAGSTRKPAGTLDGGRPCRRTGHETLARNGRGARPRRS